MHLLCMEMSSSFTDGSYGFYLRVIHVFGFGFASRRFVPNSVSQLKITTASQPPAGEMPVSNLCSKQIQGGQIFWHPKIGRKVTENNN